MTRVQTSPILDTDLSATLPALNKMPPAAPDWSRTDVVQWIDTRLVIPHEDNPRTVVNTEAFTRLVEDIKDDKIREPLVVIRGQGDTVVLISGHRRLAAAEAAGLKVVPCRLLGGEFTKAEVLELLIQYNEHREEVPPMDRARLYRKSLDLSGGSVADLARKLKISQSTVDKVLGLLELPEAIHELINTGAVRLTLAYELVDIEPQVKRGKAATRNPSLTC